MPAHQSDIWSLALSRNNLIAASGGDGSILLWNLWAISPIARPTAQLSAQILGLAFGPEGTLAAADGASAKLLNPGAAASTAPSLQNGEPISSLAFSDDGLLAAGGQEGSLRLWNAKSQTVLDTAARAHKTLTVDGVPMQDRVSQVAFSPDGSVLASAGFLDGSLLLWDGRTLAPLTEKPIKGEMGYLDSLAFSPDGETLAASSEEGMIRIWNVRTRQPLTPAIRAHGTGRPLVVFGSEIGGKPDKVFSEGAGPTFLAYSPDGTLASGGFDKQIHLWDGKTGASIGAPIAFPTPLNDIVFSPDGRMLAGSGWDGVVRLWDAKTLQYVGGLIGVSNRISRIAFSKDGATLVAGYVDGRIVSWDLRLGTWQAAAQTLANRSLTPEKEASFLGARK